MNVGNVYWDENAMREAQVYPTILAIGDSWFWYPFPGGSLINYIGDLVDAKEHIVYAVGHTGAEAYDYAYGKYRKIIKTALTRYGSDLSGIFISGGGNDFAGLSDLRPMLKDDCSKAKKAIDCFRPGNEDRTLTWLLNKTSDSYRTLIGLVFASAYKGARIVLHNYDYVVPSGKGVFGGKSTWLKASLDDAKVPEALHQDCIKIIIDGLTGMLKDLTKIDPERIHLVDSRNTLTVDDWANEIHPKPKGFKKIVQQKWRPVLEQIELA